MMPPALASRWPEGLFDDPDGTEMLTGAVLRTYDGEQCSFHPLRWHGRPNAEELDVLGRAGGDVLDVGCGPGRHVLALVEAGRTALGIDVSAVAVATARRRGAPAIQASVFEPVPRMGSWGTVLLLDGNIGIGGDPVALLARAATLLGPPGRVLVELEPPGIESRRVRVRVEQAQRRSRWIPWARVAAPHVPGLAEVSGFTVNEMWDAGGRWFADLRRQVGPGAMTPAAMTPASPPPLTLAPAPAMTAA
jgi:SAM-dependent methyltransferase